jgi:hypothetical protein
VPGAEDIRAQTAALQRRSADARERAERAAAWAARLEEQAALGAAPRSEAFTRMAALQRRVQERHLTSARLQDKYADRLCAWQERADEPEPRPAFVDAVAAAMGMHSVAVVLHGTRHHEALIAVSDPIARAAHDLEFVLGEGPAHSAVARGKPVKVTDVAHYDPWPLYGPEVARLGVRAVLAVPVHPTARLGAVCGYGREPAIGQDVAAAADAIADALPLILSEAAHDRGLDEDDSALPLFRDADFPVVIHQAAAMVSRQCDCDIIDALALLRARAFSAGRPAEEISAAVLGGELRLC